MTATYYVLRSITGQIDSYKVGTPGEGTPIFYATFNRADDALGNLPHRVAKSLRVAAVSVQVAE
jgi:hypothetical protein